MDINYFLSESTSDNIMKKLSARENNDWHLLYKLTWLLSPKKKLSISYDAIYYISNRKFIGHDLNIINAC